ncbi:Crp/Fnr family transcriptional regulator [Dyadobacter psychrotolerans]|uniref:Crp/Fnr family transcriptional regulator n=1 Tax=Dyadobacter psychrotolerans TaxID=2541721 RepID=A0A4R5DC30_9BACT|nr:hypothetical protein [Dyadobacter psychrotolerans]TDE09560.1 hypothetical protein E0F88_30190 [Dyadobacter psychrotolerans]
MPPDLIKYLSGFYSLSEEFVSHLRSAQLQKLYKKNQILSQNTSAPLFWFINNGLAKGCYYDADGKEHITRFWKEGEIMLLTHNPIDARVHAQVIVLLENATLSSLSPRRLLYLNNYFTETHKLSGKLLLADRDKADLKSYLCALPSPQGYDEFKKNFPHNRILLKDIACYLEITASSLSEIRRKSRQM